MVESTRSNRDLTSIQLLRALAAASVVWGHAEVEAEQATGRVLALGFDFGIGVDIFFLVSGFVMWLSSAKLFGQPHGVKKFLLRRFWRIVPLYWFYSAAMLAAIILVPSLLNNAIVTPELVASSFLFFPMQNALGEYQPILALGWTLNYEMFFYAIFAIGLLLPVTRGIQAIWLLLLISMVLRLVSDRGPFVFWGQPIILEFLVGVALAILYQRVGHQPSWALMALCIGSAALLLVLFSDVEVSRAVKLGIPAILGFAALVFFASPSLLRVLAPLARVVGDSSYSLYLSHPFTLGVCKVLWGRADSILAHSTFFIAVSTLVCIGVGYLSYFILERTILNMTRLSRDAGTRIP